MTHYSPLPFPTSPRPGVHPTTLGDIFLRSPLNSICLLISSPQGHPSVPAWRDCSAESSSTHFLDPSSRLWAGTTVLASAPHLPGEPLFPCPPYKVGVPESLSSGFSVDTYLWGLSPPTAAGSIWASLFLNPHCQLLLPALLSLWSIAHQPLGTSTWKSWRVVTRTSTRTEAVGGRRLYIRQGQAWNPVTLVVCCRHGVVWGEASSTRGGMLARTVSIAKKKLGHHLPAHLFVSPHASASGGLCLSLHLLLYPGHHSRSPGCPPLPVPPRLCQSLGILLTQTFGDY